MTPPLFASWTRAGPELAGRPFVMGILITHQPCHESGPERSIGRAVISDARSVRASVAAPGVEEPADAHSPDTTWCVARSSRDPRLPCCAALDR